MHDQWVHLGRLDIEENLSSDVSENFDFTSISFIVRGRLYNLIGFIYRWVTREL